MFYRLALAGIELIEKGSDGSHGRTEEIYQKFKKPKSKFSIAGVKINHITPKRVIFQALIIHL